MVVRYDAREFAVCPGVLILPGHSSFQGTDAREWTRALPPAVWPAASVSAARRRAPVSITIQSGDRRAVPRVRRALVSDARPRSCSPLRHACTHVRARPRVTAVTGLRPGARPGASPVVPPHRVRCSRLLLQVRRASQRHSMGPRTHRRSTTPHGTRARALQPQRWWSTRSRLVVTT